MIICSICMKYAYLWSQLPVAIIAVVAGRNVEEPVRLVVYRSRWCGLKTPSRTSHRPLHCHHSTDHDRHCVGCRQHPHHLSEQSFRTITITKITNEYASKDSAKGTFAHCRYEMRGLRRELLQSCLQQLESTRNQNVFRKMLTACKEKIKYHKAKTILPSSNGPQESHFHCVQP